MTSRPALAPAAGIALGGFSWAHPQHLPFQHRVARSEKRPSTPYGVHRGRRAWTEAFLHVPLSEQVTPR